MATYTDSQRVRQQASFAIEKGVAVQEMFPVVSAFYRLGFTIKEIADCLVGDKKYKELGITSSNLFQNAIRYALYGNDNEALGSFYGGLIPRDEYRGYSRENHHLGMSRAGAGSLKNGTAMFSPESKSKAISSRGAREWTKEDNSCLIDLIDSGLSVKAMAKKENRTERAIRHQRDKIYGNYFLKSIVDVSTINSDLGKMMLDTCFRKL